MDNEEKWEVLIYAGTDRAYVEEEFSTEEEAREYVDEFYSSDEVKEMNVDITRNGSTEY